VLDGVEAGGVDADEPRPAIESGPRAGGEVLEPRTDRDDDVGLRSERVGRLATRHTDRPRVERMGGEQRRLAGNGFDDRDPEVFGERLQFRLGARVVHTAAGDDQRSLG
jgi:hypothetical protein